MRSQRIKTSILNYNFILLIIFSQTFALSQKLSWRCIDKNFQAKLIEPYVDILLEENPNIEDKLIPSEDDGLIIKLKGENIDSISSIKDNGRELVLRMDIYDRLDQEIKDKLLKRKYNWDHIDPDAVKFRTRGRNVFKFSDHKTIRDYSWWIRNLLTANPFLHTYTLRPEPGVYSIMFKQGDEEIGYPSILSKNSRIFISTEPTKVFLNIPWEPKSVSYGDVHPLESTMGGGVSFDMDDLGGIVSFNSIERLTYEAAFNPNHAVYNNWTGIIYWNNSSRLDLDGDPENSKGFKLRNPWLPKGTQRVLAGVAYAKLVYGKVDSTDSFIPLEISDFAKSFSVFMNWTFVSEPERFGGYNDYSKLKIYSQMHYGGENIRFNMGFLRSLNSSLAFGLNIGWAGSITFLEGQEDQYIWKPGFVISPNFTLRF